MQNKSLVTFVIVLSSLLIIEIVDLANEIWGVQLRLLSAIMAENLLNYCGMTTERNFTIITLGSMTFDIIPACNGSESIKAILISAIFLSLINQKLNIIRKLNFFVISILVATLMNGLRISCLISLSAYIGEIIYADSILHTAIGLLFFALSVSILLKINSFLSSNQVIQRKLNFRLLAILTITFTLLPFFYACLRD